MTNKAKTVPSATEHTSIKAAHTDADLVASAPVEKVEDIEIKTTSIDEVKPLEEEIKKEEINNHPLETEEKEVEKEQEEVVEEQKKPDLISDFNVLEKDADLEEALKKHLEKHGVTKNIEGEIIIENKYSLDSDNYNYFVFDLFKLKERE